ncbi:type IV secretory system conjugative DNA transfer family protein [Clostridium thailandense]|uniref:type IV secretory system conjugative DNA transfer family protein n=1 Tax=Clostridium thailandense TaxID=2794346 RepID=UPI003988C71A
MEKRPSSVINVLFKSIVIVSLALAIGNNMINNTTHNIAVRDALGYLLVGVICFYIYIAFIASKLKNNIINRMIKSIGVFFLGCIVINVIYKINVLGKLAQDVLGWGLLIGTMYLIYKIIKGDVIKVSNFKNKKEEEGIIFGKRGSKIYYMPESETGHVSVIGGAGTGKSQSVSIPTLLTWKGAAVVIDIKKELCSMTSTFREKKLNSKVYVFDPDDNNCDCYDPLEQVKGSIDGANELARNLIPTPIKGDKFWVNNAQAILASAVLDGIDKNQTFSEICERILITKPEDLINELTESNNVQVKLLASSANGMPDKTLGGVFSELRVHILTFASDEKIKMATRKTNWTPAVLEEGATVYFRISEKMIEQYKGLISCMIAQMFRYLTSRKDRQQPAILMLLDELPRLGRVDGLIEALGTLRSRNVHIVPMIQSLSDLDRHYGQAERKIILDNCSYKVILGVGDVDTQKYFSDASGTKKVWQKSYNNSALLGLNKGNTDSLVEEKVIKPERFGQLKQDKKSVILGFKDPIEVDKLFAYSTSKYKRIIETYKI